MSVCLKSLNTWKHSAEHLKVIEITIPQHIQLVEFPALGTDQKQFYSRYILDCVYAPIIP